MRINYLGDQNFAAWVEQALLNSNATKNEPFALKRLVPLHSSPLDAVPLDAVHLDATALDDEKFCDLLLVEGLDAPQVPGNPIVVHVLSPAVSEPVAPFEQAALGPHHYVIVRGSHELQQLRPLLDLAQKRFQALTFGHAISGPFSHDMRGVIGVINLAAQVLSASEQNERMGKKLVAVGLKMSELLETIDTLAPVSLAIEEEEPVHESWTTLLGSVDAWFHASHRSRQLEVERNASPKSELQHRSLGVILRAMIDAATRYSPPSATISAQVNEQNNELIVKVNECICSEQQAIALAAPPHCWTHTGSESVPWRLWAAEQLAAERASQFDVTLSTAGLTLRFREKPALS